jgi:hypothetical protein
MHPIPGTWYLPLHGTPCAICGKAAEHLAVFPAERVVAHVDNTYAPCRLSNPTRAEFEVPVISVEARQAA